MNVQNIKIRSQEEENVGAFGNWTKVKAIAVFDNVREYFKQIQVQQEQAKNIRSRSIKAHQQNILNGLPLEEKLSLGLYQIIP